MPFLVIIYYFIICPTFFISMGTVRPQQDIWREKSFSVLSLLFSPPTGILTSMFMVISEIDFFSSEKKKILADVNTG